jgi:hypothetical protein
MTYGPIKHFKDIEAWKLARELRVKAYSVINNFPQKKNTTWLHKSGGLQFHVLQILPRDMAVFITRKIFSSVESAVVLCMRFKTT